MHLLRILLLLYFSCIFGQGSKDASSNEIPDKFVIMVNNLTQMSEDILRNDKNVSVHDTQRLGNVSKKDFQSLKTPPQKVMLVFPTSSFKEKLNRKPDAHRPLKPFRSPQINKTAPQNIADLEKLTAQEVLEAYSSLKKTQNASGVKRRVVIRRRKVPNYDSTPDNRLSDPKSERLVFQHPIRMGGYIPTSGLQIIGPIPSGFYGRTSQETTYDGILKSDLQLPPTDNNQILLDTGLTSPQFLNFVKTKYDDVIAQYNKALSSYKVYSELFNKAKQMGTV